MARGAFELPIRLSTTSQRLDIMKERLQMYALIAEIVSAIAIVVSLVFVGFQIQQSNRLSRAEAFRSPTSDINSIYAQLSREIREGILPPGSLENFSGRELLRTPYYRESWPTIKVAFDPIYVKEYEAVSRER
jgi:hypothetical protein